uniref:hypothetical protein n=1 Tax=Anaerosporobacter sp. TaxID=1872529 RepID=UPI00286F4192
MRDIRIELSLVDFLTIEECSIYKKVNEHGKARIRGIIEASKEKDVLHSAESIRYASLYVIDEKGENQVIFTGIVESIVVRTETGIKVATVCLTGSTRLLDLKERTRTFQNESITYANLMKKIESNYSD